MANQPPEYAIRTALAAAARSPCAKSKRGVAVFVTPRWAGAGQVVADGWNGAPDESCAAAYLARVLDCSVVGLANRRQPTEAEHAAASRCRDECGKRCVHAEARAIRSAVRAVAASGVTWEMLEAVHVKLGPDGELVAGGGPSCWSCSREVADVGLGGFWLYEVYKPDPPCPSERCPLCTGEECAKCHPGPGRPHCDHDVMERHEGEPDPPAAVWRRYTAAEFHRATLVACGLAHP